MWLRKWMVILMGGVVCCASSGAMNEGLARPTRQSRKATKLQESVNGHLSVLSTRDCEAALLADAETGQILFVQNGSKRWPSASLTKMMLGLLVLEEISHGHLSWQTPVFISKRATRAGGRTINLRPGEVFPLEKLLQAMLVTSANDAAVAIAERLAGSAEASVTVMNQRARELGMLQTWYQTVNGMPPPRGGPPDISSAVDIVTLARELIKYPQVLLWTSRTHIAFRDGKIKLPNTNHLVGRVAGVDGLKTGFTLKARFNLVTTAKRGQLRLIAVVMGGRSSQTRFRTAASLLEWGFSHFTRLYLIRSGEPVGADVRVEHGSISAIQPIAASDVAFLMKKNEAEELQVFLQLPSVVAAPISRYQVLGEVIVRDKTRILAVIPALSPRDIPKAHWFPAWR